jgi:hypothetical protein
MVNCSKCTKKLVYVPPSLDFTHCGTDFWTKYGERRIYPKICMACRSEVGRKAQSYQQLRSKTE